MIQPPLDGRRPAPPFERPREHTWRGVTQRLGDLTDVAGRILEHLLRRLETRFVQKLLEAGAEGIEAAIQRATVHTQERSDVIGLVLAGHERRSQEASQLGGKVVAVAFLERSDLPFEETSHLVVNSGKAVFQESRGERQRVSLRVEAKRHAEEPAVGATIERPAMRETDFARSPIAPAELVHDVAEGGEGTIADVVEALHAGIVDMPRERGRVRIYEEIDRCALDMERNVANEVTQRRPHVGSVLHEKTDETERVQTVVLSDEQSQVRTVCASRAMLEDAVTDRVRDAVFGVVKYREVVANLGQYLLGVGAQAAQDFRYRYRGRDANDRGRCRIVRAGLSHAGCSLPWVVDMRQNGMTDACP